MRRVYALVEESEAFVLEAEAERIYQAAACGLGLEEPPIRRHPALASPAAAGLLSPTILVPAHFAALRLEHAGAALCHELVHAKRRDFLWNVLLQIVSLPLAYHPVAHWVRGQIEVAREMVCDEAASQLSGGRQRYALSLLAVGLASREASTGLAVGWFTSNPLEDRIMQLLNSDETTMFRTPWLSGVCGAVSCRDSLWAHARQRFAHERPTASAGGNRMDCSPESDCRSCRKQP